MSDTHPPARSLWQAAIERAGGIESALLFGAPLKALVDELAHTQMERDRVGATLLETEKKIGAEAAALSALRADLELERGALRELSQAVEPLRLKLVAALAVVEAAREQRDKSVVLPVLSGALDRYSQHGTEAT